MPLVTAIITTYNRCQLLEKAISSVLKQTFTDFELLVLDNSSKDDTAKVIASFNDPRIKHLCHQPLNIAQARNLGVKSANGQYVAFLDDDDEWLPNKLSDQLAVFDASPATTAMVYGGFTWIDGKGNELKRHYPRLAGKILVELLEQRDAFTGSASNPMIRKSVIQDIGSYDDNVTTGEDWELYLRLACKYEIAATDKLVVNILQHDGPRLGDRLKEAAQLELLVFEKYRAIFKVRPRLSSFYFQKIGGKLVRCGDTKTGRAYLRRAIGLCPTNVLAYLQYLLSFGNIEVYRRLHKFYIVNFVRPKS